MRFLFVFILVFLMGFKLPEYKIDDLSLDEITEENIESAIVYILKKGLKVKENGLMLKGRIRPNPNHRMMKDKKMMSEFVSAINDSGEKYNIPKMFLLAISFREGSFLMDKVGKRGERSTFQIGRQVKKEYGCDLTTYAGAAECAAKHLREKVKKCGDLDGAFIFYATGWTCKMRHEHLRRVYADRLIIAKRLEDIVLNR